MRTILRFCFPATALTTALSLAAIVFLLWPQTAQAGWTNDPYNGMATVVNQPGSQGGREVIRLTSGSYFFTWLEYNEYKTKYQILDSWGNQQFGPAGEYIIQGSWQFGYYVANLIPDGAGGAIVVFSDNRNGQQEIYGQRFDEQGTPLWAPAGLPLAVWPGTENLTLYDVAYDDDGNFFFSWHYEAGYNNTDLHAQKFDLSGTRSWGDYGMPVGTGPLNQAYSQIVPDYQGGLILVWEHGSGTSYSLYTQHLDAPGNNLLPTNGLPVLSPSGGAMYAGGLAEAVPDGRGGGIWAFTTAGSANYLKVFQLSGQVVAAPQAAWMWTSPFYINHAIDEMIRHSADGTVWLLSEENRGINRPSQYLYRFDIYGRALFGNGGLPYGGDTMAPTSDGVITFNAVGEERTRVYASRVNGRGRLVWQSDVALGGTTPGGASLFWPIFSTTDGNDGAVVSLLDCRNPPGYDCSAQRVQANGQLASPLPPVVLHAGSQIQTAAGNQITYVLPQPGEVKLEVFDLLGRRISTVQEAYQQAGSYTVSLMNDRGLPSGIYLARLSTPTFQQVARMVIIR